MSRLLSILLALTYATSGFAYSDHYEQRIARQLLENGVEPEVVWLQSGNRKFLSLYRHYETAQPLGAVIILHGMGAHPDWPQLIHPLRTRLPESGWATLSLQMPVLSPELALADYGLTLADARRRVQAAVALLQERQFMGVIVLGHSFGAATAAHVLKRINSENVVGFVGISMQAQEFLSPRLKLLKQLGSIDIPILDIYGSRDRLKVRREADDRRLAARKNAHQAYTQLQINGADHDFHGYENELITHVLDWLMQTRMETQPTVGDEPKQEAKNAE